MMTIKEQNREKPEVALTRDLVSAIEVLQRDLGLPTDAIAGAVGVSTRTVERWERGEAFPQTEARRRLERLLSLKDRLNETFPTPEDVRRWVQADNRYLGGIRPVEVARAGRLDRIENALEALDSGMFI